MVSPGKLLEEVTEFADACHGAQLRRYSSDRYIVHPIRVMEICKQYTTDIALLCAALLHDVLEDTPQTPDGLRQFLVPRLGDEQAHKTVSIVIELTDVYIKINYPNWNRRKRKDKETGRLAATSAEAQTIKYADIIDNAPEITEKDLDFAKRFLFEYRALLKKITQGHPELYTRAVRLVEECIAKSIESK